ncbi:MAG TPA: hypothetical protein PLB89_07635 [Flavobacteriales bacterium]|nr:hypothetical protein [Flavobacteriales bacterium]
MAQAGTLDPNFGTDGYVTFTLNDWNVHGADALVLPNGQIMAVAGVYDPTEDIALARYNADGTLDATFGDAGVLTIDVNDGSVDWPTDAFLQADGRIVIVGRIDGAMLVLRLLEDGSLDASFNGDGWATYDVIPGELDHVGNCAVRPTGEVVVICSNENESGNGYGSVVQFTPAGALDPAFGTDGVLIVDNGSGSTTEWLHDLELSNSGSIHVLGTASIDLNSTDDTFVYRITPTGTLDMDFDEDGYRSVPIGTDQEILGALAVTADGEILVAGSTNMDGLDHPFVARLNVDGTFDAAFGDAGVHIMTDITGQSVNDLLVHASGQVVFSGEAFNGSGTAMLIARLNADGSFDPTFGNGGTTLTQIGSSFGFESGFTLALAPDGDYIMTGTTGTAPAGNLTQVILKYKSGNTSSLAEGDAASWRFHPNPTSGELWISAPEERRSSRVRIADAQGRTVGFVAMDANGVVQLPDALDAGTYYISVVGKGSAPRALTLVR